MYSQSYDPKIAKFRSVVERVMSALKRWKIMVSPWHLPAGKVESIVRTVCALTNYQLLNDCDGNW